MLKIHKNKNKSKIAIYPTEHAQIGKAQMGDEIAIALTHLVTRCDFLRRRYYNRLRGIQAKRNIQ